MATRVVSAAIGSASIYFVYRLGARVLPSRVWRPDLIMALAWATCPLAAWQARWGLIETTLVFIGLLSMLAILRIADCGHLRDYLLASAGVALSAAAKIYGATLVIPYVAAHWLRWRGRSLSIAGRPSPLISLLTGAGAMAVIYLVVNPATVATPLLDVRGSVSEIQQLGNPKNLLQLPLGFYLTTVRWNLGTWSLPFLAIGLLATVRRRSPHILLCALFGVSFILLLGLKREAFHIYQRYTLLALPFLFSVVFYGVVAVSDFVGDRQMRFARSLSSTLVPALVTLLVAWNGLESLAQRPIYHGDYEVVEEVATRWFIDSQPAGARVLVAGKLPWPGHQTIPLFDRSADYLRRYEERNARMNTRRGGWIDRTRHHRVEPLRDLAVEDYEIPRFDLVVLQQRDIAEDLDTYLREGVDVFVIDPEAFYTFFQDSETTEPGTRSRALAKDRDSRRRLYEELQSSDRVELVKRFEGRVTPGGSKVIEIFEAVK